MKRFRITRGAVAALVLSLGPLGGAAFIGCGTDDSATFDGPELGDGGNGGTESGPIDFGDGGAGDRSTPSCVNLQCFQQQCAGEDVTTTLTGKVYDPAGKNPLYNAIVYVPNAPLQPVPEGLSCDTCGVLASGSPIAVAVTNPDGSFELKDVPAGVEFPLVVQVGKWRRVVNLPQVGACQTTALTDVELTRLPRNQGEGNIPRMAIATGGADPFECLLRKIGIDDAEFTLPTGTGRIHMWKAYDGVDRDVPGLDAGDDSGIDASTPAAPEFWGDDDAGYPNKMQGYDLVMLPCEGGDHTENKAPVGRQGLLDYVNLGGRVFVTHYAYTWLEASPQPLPIVANWEHDETDRSDQAGASEILVANIDTGFPKGKAFADWLSLVGNGDAGYGTLPINQWRHDVASVNNPPSQQWIHADTRTAWSDPDATPPGAHDVTQHFTFNTPIEAGVDDAGQPLQCGKVVFSDFHVSADQRNEDQPFPASCKSDPMTPQEKALEFMLFDLSACIQKEDAPISVPPVVK